MISATDLELRAGSRILLSGVSLRVQPGDRIGLVGRNGAGKTTTLRVLASEGEPYAGEVRRAAELGRPHVPLERRVRAVHVGAGLRHQLREHPVRPRRNDGWWIAGRVLRAL